MPGFGKRGADVWQVLEASISAGIASVLNSTWLGFGFYGERAASEVTNRNC